MAAHPHPPDMSIHSTDAEKALTADTDLPPSSGLDPVHNAPPVGLPPPPDGGLTAWMTVAGAFIVSFVQFGLINTYGVFQEYYESSLLSEYSPSDVAWIGGLQQFLLFFGGLFAGRWFDAHGAHILIIPGAICIVLSLMFVSVSTQFYQLLLSQGILFGIGSALIFFPSIAVPGQWFVRRRALAMGIVGASSGLGGTLWPIALNRLITEIGFPWAVRTIGFISLFLFAIGTVMIKTRLPRKRPTPWRQVFRPFRELAFCLLTASVSLVFWGLYAPFFYVSSRALTFGASSSLAFYCIAFINAGSTVGRLLASVGDHWGAFNVLIASGLGSTVILLGFWIPLSTTAQLIACTVLYGLFVGGFIAIIPACVATTGPATEIGMRVGILWTVASFFSLTGPPINGSLLSKYTVDGIVTALGYRYVGVFSGIVALAGTFCAVGAKWKLGGKLWNIL